MRAKNITDLKTVINYLFSENMNIEFYVLGARVKFRNTS